MYLMDSSAAAVNNRKWNLGRLGNGILNMPVVPSGGQNPSPVSGSASNGGITTVMATRPSTNPLDYTSPQAAIAAGLDPPTVYGKWTAALAKFPSPQAAISAGVPAGVVNQLWQQSYQNAANKAAGRGMGRLGLQPVRLPNLGRLGTSGTGQPWRMRGMRGLRFFGDDAIDTTMAPDDNTLIAPPMSPIALPSNSGTIWAAQNPSTPVSTTSVPMNAPLQAPPTLPISLIPGAKAGAPVFYNAVTGAVSSAPPPAAPAGGTTIFGMSPTTLLYAGAALFGLAALGGGGRRR